MIDDGFSSPRVGVFWWIRQVVLVMMGLFFLLFGTVLLIAAYHLDTPHHFIMTFFASSLIILISLTLLVGFIWRMVAAMRAKAVPPGDGDGVHRASGRGGGREAGHGDTEETPIHRQEASQAAPGKKADPQTSGQ